MRFYRRLICCVVGFLVLAACSSVGSYRDGASQAATAVLVDSLRTELNFRESHIESLYEQIEYLNFQVDSLYSEIDILSSRVLINDTFEIPRRYSFAGVDIDLTNDRVWTKLQDIYNVEVRSARNYIPRSGIYFALFDSILVANNMHPDVKYLAVAESHLNSMSTSVANAGGIWQFIPSTARAYDLRIDDYVDERRNIFKATAAACAYLHRSVQQLRAVGVNDFLLALAAYNSGIGNITRSIREQGGNDFASLIMRVEETNNYVWRAIALKMIFENEDTIFPNKFERMTPLLETARVHTVTLNGYYDLVDWATAQGTTVSAIWELNPWINISRNRTGRYSQINHLILPKGTFEILVPRDGIQNPARIAEIETKFLEENNSAFISGTSVTHRVARGETLLGIANRYGVRVDDIRRWNNISGTLIREGQTLHIQGSTASSSSSSTTNTTSTQSTATRGTYRVVAGDTLSQIAEKLGVATNHLRTKNNLTSDTIHIGQVLQY